MRKFFLALVLLLVVEQVGALCPEKFAILFQGSEQFWKSQDDLLRTLVMNKFRQENIMALSAMPFSLKRQVLTPSRENLVFVVDALANTSCADEVVIDLAGEAVAIWDAEIERWDGSDRQKKQFFGRPYSSVPDKNYSACFDGKKIKHLKECADLVKHHRDVPDGYRVVGEPVIADWCLMMGNACVRSGELASLLNKIPARKTIIAAASYAGMLELPNADIFAASRSFEPAAYVFHKAFVQSLFKTKMNFIDSFAQAKAFTIGTSGTMPQVVFSKGACSCPQSTAAGIPNQPPKAPIILPVQKPEVPQTTPPILPEVRSEISVKISPPPASIIAPSPRKVAFVVKKPSEPAVMRKLPESDCLAQCAKITVAAPREAKSFSSEILEAETPAECREKASFATFLQREPCMNYYITVREISKRVGSGTEFACCCRRIAKEEKRDCTQDIFLGWNDLGAGIVKGEGDVLYKFTV